MVINLFEGARCLQRLGHLTDCILQTLGRYCGVSLEIVRTGVDWHRPRRYVGANQSRVEREINLADGVRSPAR